MAKQVELVEIQPLDIRKTVVGVVGDTPLITHAWSEKAQASYDAAHSKRRTEREESVASVVR